MRTYADNGGPFYLSVHYTAPHSPWTGEKGRHPEEYLALYTDTPFTTAPQEPMHPWATDEWLTTRHLGDREALKGYYAAVSAMDFNIGRLLRQLEDLGLRENTLVVFTSDNGMATGHHGFWGKGNGTSPRNMYDSTIKLPFIVSQPGRIPAGAVNEDLLSSYDFFPTLLEYVGLEEPADKRHRPGRSFAPVLRGGELPEETFVVLFDEYGPVRMIRTERWKLVRRYPEGPDELYNMIADPRERVNRIDDPKLAETIADLDAQLEAFFDDHTDPGMTGLQMDGMAKGQSEKLTR